ncbi:MAG: hypothetical protein ACJAV1_003404 [Paraglaciecola sp.]|jgi:hypothetical protein
MVGKMLTKKQKNKKTKKQKNKKTKKQKITILIRIAWIGGECR